VGTPYHFLIGTDASVQTKRCRKNVQFIYLITNSRIKMKKEEIEALVEALLQKARRAPDACLSNPRVISFYKKMKDEVEGSLQRMLQLTSNIEDSDKRQAKYERCVDAVLEWDAEIRSAEVHKVVEKYPSIKDEYMYSVVFYVKQTYKQDKMRVKLKLPSFDTFFFNFYHSIMESPPVHDGSFFRFSFFERETLICQAFCSALFSSVRTVPLSTSTDADELLHKDRGLVLSPLGTRDTAGSRDTARSRIDSHSLLVPEDSVSQMPHQRNVNLSHPGGLNPKTLSKHYNNMTPKSSTENTTSGSTSSKEILDDALNPYKCQSSRGAQSRGHQKIRRRNNSHVSTKKTPITGKPQVKVVDTKAVKYGDPVPSSPNRSHNGSKSFDRKTVESQIEPSFFFSATNGPPSHFESSNE
jgi:hypothetical protein